MVEPVPAGTQSDCVEPGAGLRLALYQPDIPQNTGTMLRMAACLGIGADIIEPAGFPVSDRAFRRAGMDYLDMIAIRRHLSFAAFEEAVLGEHRRVVLLTTKASVAHHAFAFEARDILLVGRESAGMPPHVQSRIAHQIRVPMHATLRSLNVAVAAAIVCSEALRQLNAWPHLPQGAGP